MRLLAILLELILAACAYGGPLPVAAVVDRSPVASGPALASVAVWHNSDGGTGTVIHSEGGRSLIITAAHVVEDGNGTLSVTTSSGVRHSATYLFGSRVRHTGPGMIAVDGPDLALLEVNVALPAVPVAESEPGLRARVRLWGYGGGRFRAIVGEALGFARFESPPNSLSSLPTISGDSGGGVINDAGELVAVHSGTDGNRARHVPLSVVREFLKGKVKESRDLPAVVAHLPVAAPADPGWSVTGNSTAPVPGCRWAYWPPLGRMAWVHESLLSKAAAPNCPEGQP